jgi:hypothetical protein
MGSLFNGDTHAENETQERPTTTRMNINGALFRATRVLNALHTPANSNFGESNANWGAECNMVAKLLVSLAAKNVVLD